MENVGDVFETLITHLETTLCPSVYMFAKLSISEFLAIDILNPGAILDQLLG